MVTVGAAFRKQKSPILVSIPARSANTPKMADTAMSIIGIDVVSARPCGAKLRLCWCSCCKVRIDPHSVKSPILIWKCASCSKRHGRPSAPTIQRIEHFIERYGWTHRPLVLCDDGVVRVY